VLFAPKSSFIVPKTSPYSFIVLAAGEFNDSRFRGFVEAVGCKGFPGILANSATHFFKNFIGVSIALPGIAIGPINLKRSFGKGFVNNLGLY
jgi:hypothetical protein